MVDTPLYGLLRVMVAGRVLTRDRGGFEVYSGAEFYAVFDFRDVDGNGPSAALECADAGDGAGQVLRVVPC